MSNDRALENIYIYTKRLQTVQITIQALQKIFLACLNLPAHVNSSFKHKSVFSWKTIVPCREKKIFSSCNSVFNEIYLLRKVYNSKYCTFKDWKLNLKMKAEVRRWGGDKSLTLLRRSGFSFSYQWSDFSNRRPQIWDKQSMKIIHIMRM